MTKKPGKKPFYQGKSLDHLRKVCYSDLTSKRALFFVPIFRGRLEPEKILLEGRLRVSCGAVPSRLLGRENGAEPAD
mgnify:CR=1 FL=1